MRESDARERAFAMPLTSPAYPPGPYRFVNHLLSHRPGEAARAGTGAAPARRRHRQI